MLEPCEGDPCGRYAQCKDISGIAACSCLPGYVGTPPNCRPECLIHSECPSDKACINEKCRDPCPGACGAYAECSVIQHNAVCRCQSGYEGDAFSACRRITTSEYSTNYNYYSSSFYKYTVVSIVTTFSMVFSNLFVKSSFCNDHLSLEKYRATYIRYKK